MFELHTGHGLNVVTDDEFQQKARGTGFEPDRDSWCSSRVTRTIDSRHRTRMQWGSRPGDRADGFARTRVRRRAGDRHNALVTRDSLTMSWLGEFARPTVPRRTPEL
ncbi:hypothetical protein C9J85_11080 [Haloferax sp. wsp5]|nr:hypothetical protein C9J85_11080 [Haloferax sp. wsp5]